MGAALSRDPFAGTGVAGFDIEQSGWCAGRLSLLSGLRGLAERRRRWLARSGQSLAAANADLRGMVDALRVRGISPFVGQVGPVLCYDFDDDELVEWCDAQARTCERVINHCDGQCPGLRVLAFLDSLGIDGSKLFSRRSKSGELVEVNWRARVTCPAWWRRKVRVLCARGAELYCRGAGYTSRRSGAYVSDFTFTRWQSAQRRGRSVIEAQDIIDNDTGEVLSLSAAVDASVSNPEHRRGELMTRARGFELAAEKLGYDCLFLTVTCPSRFHVWSGGRKNKKFDGSSPRDASKYLTGLWAAARARLARLGVDYFGFRVAEPHHDGCPHWHLLLFVDPAHKWALVEVMHGHALADSPDETGADKHRFEAVQIDLDSGSNRGATGYIAKYISKNIDGHRVGDDTEALAPADVSALRVRAWASTWGIRQFQQVGGPSVTVWRELRRIARDSAPVVGGQVYRAALEAADSGDWLGFVDAMGGAVLARKDRPLAPFYSAWVAGRERFGRYGEKVTRVIGIVGDKAGGAVGLAISRWKSWVVRRRDDITKGYAIRSDGITCGYLGFIGPPSAGLLDSCQ